MMEEEQALTTEEIYITPHRDHFPMCIVWSPIPCLTWFCPFIGHLGVATTDGTIHDFIGPYTINKSPKQTGFGIVTKYLPVKSEELSPHTDKYLQWDRSIEKASEKYEHLMHNLLMNNCHSHVATALNELSYLGRSNWNTLYLIILMALKGKHVSVNRSIYTYLPFIILFGIFVLLLLFGFITIR